MGLEEQKNNFFRFYHPLLQHSIALCGWYELTAIKSSLISKGCRNSETSNHFLVDLDAIP